jgi:hypothetical protein
LVAGINQLTNKEGAFFEIRELEVWQIKNIEAKQTQINP